LPQESCHIFDNRAVFFVWDSGFITSSWSRLAHGSTKEKARERVIGGSLDDGTKSFDIEGCFPRAVDHHAGRHHIMAVSSPPCFFAFETAEKRDCFMKNLQGQQKLSRGEGGARAAGGGVGV
jgi:hypothetical protein